MTAYARRRRGRSGRPGRGQEGFGVVGSHPDGVGELLDFGLQANHVRVDLAEADAGGNGGRRVLGGLEFGPAVWTGASRALIIWLVMVTGWPGAGLRRAARLVSRWAWAAAARISVRRTWAAAAFLAGFGTFRPGSSGVAAWESRASRAKWVRA